ncbi:hypothetical protein BOTBODRAFT_185505 [Botryobasidium botryosum FD-172 SS1]|uniref:Uncharacterized protein n=1 Tax=Botryobasidium botryosum (strain FD-172 SS1) TaxID=930990 RepID=A0A067N1U2_BOTB1|nr:hypothetical protein BOTBODRAFT_185505 [Botryobasidium botryosum FD-172 SS1]
MTNTAATDLSCLEYKRRPTRALIASPLGPHPLTPSPLGTHPPAASASYIKMTMRLGQHPPLSHEAPQSSSGDHKPTPSALSPRLPGSLATSSPALDATGPEVDHRLHELPLPEKEHHLENSILATSDRCTRASAPESAQELAIPPCNSDPASPPELANVNAEFIINAGDVVDDDDIPPAVTMLVMSVLLNAAGEDRDLFARDLPVGALDNGPYIQIWHLLVALLTVCAYFLAPEPLR